MSTRTDRANAIRALAMDAVQADNSGHPGAPMGLADIAEILWREVLRHNLDAVDPADDVVVTCRVSRGAPGAEPTPGGTAPQPGAGGLDEAADGDGTALPPPRRT